MTATRVRVALRPPAALPAARGVLGVVGAVKLAATGYFTFVASAKAGGHPQGVTDRLVAGWSSALAVSFLVAAARLRAERARPLGLTAGLLTADLAFCGVKLVRYGEPPALAFMAVDGALLALLRSAARGDRG